MLDIKFIRENPDAVKENIKKKFQDEKLPLVDELLDLDAKNRAATKLRNIPHDPLFSTSKSRFRRKEQLPPIQSVKHNIELHSRFVL